MMVGIDLRLSIDEAYALVWVLEKMSQLSDRLKFVPRQHVDALPAALGKTLETVVEHIAWAVTENRPPPSPARCSHELTRGADGAYTCVRCKRVGDLIDGIINWRAIAPPEHRKADV